MIGASHIVAGAAIGAVCPRARFAVPVAFASHFLMDQIPHSCFNMLPAATPAVLITLGQAAGCVAVLWAIALAARSPARWVMAAAAVAAFSPDPLTYMRPFKDWFALVPGSWVVPWVHSTFHWDVTRTHAALGFATQVVVIAAGFCVLARNRAKHSRWGAS